jgi:hypothetical protein
MSSDADNVETSQEEEDQYEKVSKDIDNDERSTIDETISQALAIGMPAELGAPPAAAAAPAELGAPPAELGAPPAELGAPPAELGAPPAELGAPPAAAPAPKPAVSKPAGFGDNNWPLDRFADGLYAPEGVPYPLRKATELGPMNKFTGLLDNPDGTKSFPDGTMVDAPNTWLMTEDNVVPVDEYKNELTMAEEEAHALEIQNAKNEAAYNDK